MVIPAAYHSAKSHNGIDDEVHILPFINASQVVDGSDLDDASNHGLRIISRGTAILLLIVYIAYLFFQLKSHHYLYQSDAERDEEGRINGTESLGADVPPIVTIPVENEEEQAEMNRAAAGMGLLGATLVTSFCADYCKYSCPPPPPRWYMKSLTCVSLSSGGLDRGDSRTVLNPACIHRSDSSAHCCERGGARHVRMDGDEGQNGAHHRNMRRQLNSDRRVRYPASCYCRLDVRPSSLCNEDKL